MRIDFRVFNGWSVCNDVIAESLGVDLNKTAVRTYQGTSHALVEVCAGLAKLYPLKKKIYYFKHMNPFFEMALTPLAKEGYKLAALDLDILKNPVAWAASLEREDLFVLYSVDEPLLGRAYDVSGFEEALKDKGLFKIRVSHARHFYELDQSHLLHRSENGSVSMVEKNSALIYTVSSTQAIGLLGERGKIGALVADQLFHDEKNFEGSWFKTPQPLDSKKVLLFEARRPADSRPVFAAADLRVTDRAAIYWVDMDGHAVIARLAEKLNFHIGQPGQENRLESPSLSRWGGVRTMDFLKSQGMTPEMIRGTVLISHQIIDQNGEFEKILNDVRKSILNDQLGVL